MGRRAELVMRAISACLFFYSVLCLPHEFEVLSQVGVAPAAIE